MISPPIFSFLLHVVCIAFFFVVLKSTMSPGLMSRLVVNVDVAIWGVYLDAAVYFGSRRV